MGPQPCLVVGERYVNPDLLLKITSTPTLDRTHLLRLGLRTL